MRKLVFLSVILLSFNGYSQFVENTEDYILNEVQSKLIKVQKIKRVVREDYKAPLDKIPVGIATTVYDENGNEIEYTYESVISKRIEKYIYNADALLIEEFIDDRRGNRKLKDMSGPLVRSGIKSNRYEYDSSNRVLLKEVNFHKWKGREYPKLMHNYFYYKDSLRIEIRDKKGTLIETKLVYEDELNKTILEKDHADVEQLKKTLTYNSEKSLLKIQEYIKGKPLIQLEIYFDEGRKIVKERKVLYLSIGTDISVTTYLYDEHNRLIKKEEISKTKRIMSKYFYNDKGLLIKVLNEFGRGVVMPKERRYSYKS